MNEIIDIGLDSTSGGLEFLMNTSSSNKKSSSVEIDQLEKELNDLSNIKPFSSSRPTTPTKEEGPTSSESWWSPSNLGAASADYLSLGGETKTWDGYTKVNDGSFSNVKPSGSSSDG